MPSPDLFKLVLDKSLPNYAFQSLTSYALGFWSLMYQALVNMSRRAVLFAVFIYILLGECIRGA